MKLGFIGCGNMAKAMISGVLSSSLLSKNEIFASDNSDAQLLSAREKYEINTLKCNTEIAQKCDYVVLAVKPNYYEAVIEQIKDYVDEKTVIITIAAGKSIDFVSGKFGKKVKIIRTMPNTPAMVGEGMTAVCPNEFVSESELEIALSVFNSFGKSALVAETMIDAVIAVSGSSPAYVYMFIEAMADAAVIQGMPREMAYQFASQAVIGSAKTVMETGIHPGKLKDMVCSPAGTTIEAVRVLEEKGFRSSIIEAMTACAEKSKNM